MTSQVCWTAPVSTGPRSSVTTGPPRRLGRSRGPAAGGGPPGGGLGGHPTAVVTDGIAGTSSSIRGYLRWFLPPGRAERMLPKDEWRLFRGLEVVRRGGKHRSRLRPADRRSLPGRLRRPWVWISYCVNRGSAAAADRRAPVNRQISCPTMGCGPVGTSSWRGADDPVRRVRDRSLAV